MKTNLKVYIPMNNVVSCYHVYTPVFVLKSTSDVQYEIFYVRIAYHNHCTLNNYAYHDMITITICNSSSV